MVGQEMDLEVLARVGAKHRGQHDSTIGAVMRVGGADEVDRIAQV
jgi:hypothetical protein